MAGNRPISIEFVADVSRYLREVKKVEISTDDISEALVAVTNSGDDLERKLGRAMKDAAKDAEILERAIKNVGDSADRAGDEAKRGFDKFGQSVKDAGDDAASSFGETGKEAGSEFASNLAEGLSSGDLESVAKDTAFGLLTAFQSVPLAGQVAIGLTAAATAAYTIIKGQSEKAKQEIQGLFDTFVEEGAEAVRLAVQNSGLEQLGGTVAQGWIDLKGIADDIGISVGNLAGIIDGELNPLEKESVRLMEEKYANLLEQGTTQEKLTTEQIAQMEAIGRILPMLDDQTTQYEAAATAAGIATDEANKPITPEGLAQFRSEMEGAATASGEVRSNLEKMPKLIPVRIEYTEVNKPTGGAFATSGGGVLRPIYQQKFP